MLQKCLLTLCLIGCARPDSTEERLNALERIIELQSMSITSLNNENNELKIRVIHLENKFTQIADDIQREKAKDDSSLYNKRHFNDRKKYINETAGTTEKKVVNEQTGLDLNMKVVNSTLNERTSNRLLGQAGGIAFHVYLTASTCYNDQQIIAYDGVEIDLGSGYDKNNGVYVVPVSGVYVFIWTLFTDYSHDFVSEILVNGVRKGVTLADGSPQALFLSTSTSQVVLDVIADDQVSIRRVRGRGCTAVSYDSARTTFSGWLIFL